MIFRPQRDRRRTERGFSMIEVLVTMAVVAIGLMGLIALMMKGLQANAASSMRTIATNQAYDMADRIRANLKGVVARNYDAILPPGSTSTCPIDVSAGNHVAPPSASPGSCSVCSSSCVASDIAARDACLWHEANANLLPSGAGAVCKEAGKNWYSVFVSWDENKSGNPNKTFVLRFEP